MLSPFWNLSKITRFWLWVFIFVPLSITFIFGSLIYIDSFFQKRRQNEVNKIHNQSPNNIPWGTNNTNHKQSGGNKNGKVEIQHAL